MKPRITLTLAAIFLAVAAVAIAQMREHEPVATMPPPAAKYELIQNSRALKETYLLDRNSGSTWQLRQSADQVSWGRIPKESHEKDIVPKDWVGAAYQISVSGLAVRGTYMINVITGATWVLLEDPKEGIFWGNIPEPI